MAVRDVDDVVDGRAALPVEEGRKNEVRANRRPIDPLPYEYRNADLSVTPHHLTWRLAVFKVASRSSTCWVEVPGTRVRPFLRLLHSGLLDDALRSRRRWFPIR
jgi:hypothetical protein